MKPILLASQSPRRKELLSILQLPFETAAADIDEKIDVTLPIHEEIMRLAYAKASHFQTQYPDHIIIGSDTLVLMNQIVLGKPKDEEEAKAMLRSLSGNTHQVITGVCLLSKEKTECFYQLSHVTFFPLSEEEIQKYVATKEPMDKAGAYGIQGYAMKFIKEIQGDYYAIMGLPIAQLYQHLKDY